MTVSEITIYETPEALRLVPQLLAIDDDRTEATVSIRVACSHASWSLRCR